MSLFIKSSKLLIFQNLKRQQPLFSISKCIKFNTQNQLSIGGSVNYFCTSTTTTTTTTTDKNKIYTRTGDKGTSSLFNGERRGKNDEVFNALGTIDELTAHIGLSIHLMLLEKQQLPKEQQQPDLFKEQIEHLEEIQSLLLDLGSHVATPRSQSPEPHLKRTGFNEEHVDTLELRIDEMTQYLPPLRNFILPGGGLAASQIHVARSVCRRAERELVPLLMRGDIESTASKYVNRLSDYFFTLARYTNHCLNQTEAVYKAPSDRKLRGDTFKRTIEKRPS
eukprot:gene7721-9496_t